MTDAVTAYARAESLIDLVGVGELRRRYGPPASWWYAKAETGEIPSFKLGKYRRFRLQEIEQWIEAHRHETNQSQNKPRPKRRIQADADAMIGSVA